MLFPVFEQWLLLLQDNAPINLKLHHPTPQPPPPPGQPLGHLNFLKGQVCGIECFHMTSWRPYWCPKTMKRRPWWCPKPILWELNSFLMQMLSFVPINLHRCWPREWKHSIVHLRVWQYLIVFKPIESELDARREIYAGVFLDIWFDFICPHNSYSSLFLRYVLQPVRIRFTALSCSETNISLRVFLWGLLHTHTNKAVTNWQTKFVNKPKE